MEPPKQGTWHLTLAAAQTALARTKQGTWHPNKVVRLRTDDSSYPLRTQRMPVVEPRRVAAQRKEDTMRIGPECEPLG